MRIDDKKSGRKKENLREVGRKKEWKVEKKMREERGKIEIGKGK